MKIAIIFFFAVLSEVTATTALKFSEGFTKLVPSVIVVVGYGLSFYLLSLALKVMPIGIAYALWSGIGIVLTVIAGMVLWRESLGGQINAAPMSYAVNGRQHVAIAAGSALFSFALPTD